MIDLINTWHFNLLGFLVSVVVFYQFYKLAVRNAKVDGAATIALQAIAGISILVFLPFFQIRFPTDIRIYILLLIACIFYALNDRLQTTARKHLPVSVFSIINELHRVILIAYGFIFFNEALVAFKVIGAFFVLAGNLLLLYRGGRIEINKYSLTAILATVAFATAISIDIGISKSFNLPFYIMFTLIVPALLIKIFERISIKSVLEEASGKEKRFYLITGISWALAILFSLRSFQLGKVSTIVPLQATSVLFNVLVAYLFLGERTEKLKKIMASILVIIGVFFTVINS